MNRFETLSEAYLATLRDVVDRPDFVVAPRGIACLERVNYGFTVESPSGESIRTCSDPRDAVMSRYLAAEKKLYLTGELSAGVWAEEASRFWGGLANDDGTINSNYGWLMFKNPSLPGGRTPWGWARDALTRDQDTRQAFVRLSLPEHQKDGVRDQVCTMHLMFMARGRRLHLTTVMRSNDVVRGLAYDAPWFCDTLEMMSREVGVPAGTYSHLSHSMHAYERDLSTIDEMLGRTR